MTSEDPKSSGETPEKITLQDQVTKLINDLLYPSESDEPLAYVTCYLKQEAPLTVSQIKDWQMLPPEVFVEEIPEADFWEPVVTGQDWYGDEEKARTEKFQQLKTLLETELTVRQVFRVGEGELDVFLLGRQADGERAGLQTKIVQT